MSNLVQLEQQLFAHDLEGAHLARVFLLCEEDLAIAALANLGQNLEVALLQSDATLAKVGSLSTGILGPQLSVAFLVSGGRCRDVGLEGGQPLLSRADIRK